MPWTPLRGLRLGWRWHALGKPEWIELRDDDPARRGEVAAAITGLTSVNCGAKGEPGRGRTRWVRVPFSDDGCAFVFFVVRTDGGGLGGLLLDVPPDCPREPDNALLELALDRLAGAPDGW